MQTTSYSKRKELMELMNNSDDFFKEYGLLDDAVFSESVISKKNKELIMISISIVQKCEECIIYHIDEALTAGSSKEEIIESIKIGMMSSGSTSYPYVRFAFAILKNKNLL